jgi:lysosomal Pro-X carboxypeptidase
MLLLPLAACCTAALPPQYPNYYTVKTLRQPVDHFNAEDHATFQERYLLNDTWWAGPGAPILFYTGAEGSGVEAIFSHSGYIMDLAQNLSALVGTATAIR